MSDDWRSRARKIPKGNLYDDFEVGQVFQHHWGRTLSESDNTLFSTLTLSYNPLYFNAPFARAHGHRQVVVNPMLVFTTVFGLSVEDLSEAGGLFLGVDELTFHRRVYPGQTLVARSTVVDKRESHEPSRKWNRYVAYRGISVSRRIAKFRLMSRSSWIFADPI